MCNLIVMKNTFLLTLFFALVFSFTATAEVTVDDLLKELDQAIEQRDEYLKEKQQGKYASIFIDYSISFFFARMHEHWWCSRY